ncbi:uncharacterized protein [Panulirus ornatus]|uniref:uncharacterized protein n=1 Tax=Panulirus ornatus TaxID=150431 RepID=UPI003A8B5ACE
MARTLHAIEEEWRRNLQVAVTISSGRSPHDQGKSSSETPELGVGRLSLPTNQSASAVSWRHQRQLANMTALRQEEGGATHPSARRPSPVRTRAPPSYVRGENRSCEGNLPPANVMGIRRLPFERQANIARQRNTQQNSREE